MDSCGPEIGGHGLYVWSCIDTNICGIPQGQAKSNGIDDIFYLEDNDRPDRLMSGQVELASLRITSDLNPNVHKNIASSIVMQDIFYEIRLQPAQEFRLFSFALKENHHDFQHSAAIQVRCENSAS